MYHIIGWGSGVLLDLIIGDPHGIPHPIVAVGRLIAFLDGRWNTADTAAAGVPPRRKRFLGVLLCVAVLTMPVAVTAGLLTVAWRLHPAVFVITEAVLTCYLLAARSLYDESRKVQKDLERGDLHTARRDLSMIVGRDTQELEEEAVVRAAVETVAENTSDGVIAPLLYLAVGGPALGILYKAANTMDSMVGYNNDRYRFFGRPAARLDDLLNYLPSRLSALLMILAAALPGMRGRGFHPADAWRIWRRDRRKHKSPNSAQTESVCAGALQIRLGGPSRYQGVLVEKPWIGDAVRGAVKEDIGRSGLLMFVTEGVAVLLLATDMLAVL
ncbi:MAG: cobalamin biosynthesis protein CobD [Butyrivibrio sp.]|nr:cobalamin biosynthesis protein CobD [Butyrivibrio sp.]